ncbi:MAG: GH3 auxin-responsive promoter family protein [Bacteroidetes bacterium]|nr:GH3 auxin-responsive promoter family protein [Bacteroidota bacterium]MBS1738972.1 GH3 auxin-responsive promoter family protein [Bacteroidota bacterium]MBS1775471.1 GH3 auxin-responsive promoter family protein [Bacteroidota bacterium]
MSIISPALKGFIKLRQSAIDNFVLNPIDTQQQVFNNLISSAQHTEYGKRFNFYRLNTVSDFKNNVPITDYDVLKPFIHRIMEGEQNILWPSQISWFAKSSGTTSDKSKFIPISKESLDDNHFKAGKDTLALYLKQFPQSDIMSGKCLVIGGSHQVNQLNTESFYGDLSAVMLQNMPLVGQWVRTPDLSIALMDEWEQKIEMMAQSTIHDNVTQIAGVPTWTLVLIKRLFEIAGTDNLHDIWPDLELYIHGGVSFKPYRTQFQSLFPKRPIHFQETYNASEGFFAVQDDLTQEGLLLLLNHGIFYEFMPMEEVGKEDGKTLSLKEVELGKNYALVISTNCGLWRYTVGDTIQFTSLNPYRIKVSGRLKHFINAFGEEVIVDNADYAIAEACHQTGAQVNDYSAAPVYMTNETNGAHEWIIEFETPPNNFEAFVSALDLALQHINSDYEAKRHKDIALRRPIVHIMPINGFKNWLKDKGKLGGQHKVPRLSNDRKFLEEMLPYTKR